MSAFSNHQYHQERIDQAMTALAASIPGVNQQWRLTYHLMPPANWMNDPNGLVYFKGEYHVFYQHHPYQPNWGPMHWGHAKSGDLVHWHHLPIALAPSEWYDYELIRGGCYSGSAVDNNGVLTLIYTGKVGGEKSQSTQCIATSTDGVTFAKHPLNPVIGEPPIDGLQGFRDPKVWRHGDYWYMVIGSGKNDQGLILFYRSANLVDWHYLGVPVASEGKYGTMWECPELFPLDDKHVLIFSPMGLDRLKTMYFVGELDYDTGQFAAELSGELDYGGDFYAAQSLLDSQGRRILVAWMDCWHAGHPTAEHGWVGALTIPRVLRLGTDGKLVSEPVPELRMLRQDLLEYTQLAIEDHQVFVPQRRGDCLEIELAVDLINTTARKLVIMVRCDNNDQQYTAVIVQLDHRRISVDPTHSGAGQSSVTSCCYEDGNGSLTLRLFLDKSSLEVFVNGGKSVLTNRIYPAEDSLGIKLTSQQGSANLHFLRLWDLR